jgi:cob(I)alamin adenosyltransferase
MGHRLTKIYTATGDKGTTGLGDGSRVSKDNPRIAINGAIDELNSVIGLVLTHSLPTEINQQLNQIQHQLFDLGGELCIPGHRLLAKNSDSSLEQWIDKHNSRLPPLKEFVLPGGHRAAAEVHLARTVCRRAERQLVHLSKQAAISNTALRYLNRLSDYLFVIARVINQDNDYQQPLWQHSRQ